MCATRVCDVSNWSKLQLEMCNASLFQTTWLFIYRLVRPEIEHNARDIGNDVCYFRKRLPELESGQCGFERKLTIRKTSTKRTRNS